MRLATPLPTRPCFLNALDCSFGSNGEKTLYTTLQKFNQCALFKGVICTLQRQFQLKALWLIQKTLHRYFRLKPWRWHLCTTTRCSKTDAKRKKRHHRRSANRNDWLFEHDSISRDGSRILTGRTILEALNTDLVCDAINVAMRENLSAIRLRSNSICILWRRPRSGAALEDLGQTQRSQK